MFSYNYPHFGCHTCLDPETFIRNGSHTILSSTFPKPYGSEMSLLVNACEAESPLNPGHTTSSQANHSMGGSKNQGERRRTQVACARCRKRKIKCSGEPGDGTGCTNCRQAGVDLSQCYFNRVGSTTQLLRTSGGRSSNTPAGTDSKNKPLEFSSRPIIQRQHLEDSQNDDSTLVADTKRYKPYSAPSTFNVPMQRPLQWSAYYPFCVGYLQGFAASPTMSRAVASDACFPYFHHSHYPRNDVETRSVDHGTPVSTTSEQKEPSHPPNRETALHLPVPVQNFSTENPSAFVGCYKRSNENALPLSTRHSSYSLSPAHAEWLHGRKSMTVLRANKVVPESCLDMTGPDHSIPLSSGSDISTVSSYPSDAPTPPFEASAFNRCDQPQILATEDGLFALCKPPVYPESQDEQYSFRSDVCYSSYDQPTRYPFSCLVSGEQYFSPYESAARNGSFPQMDAKYLEDTSIKVYQDSDAQDQEQVVVGRHHH